MQHPRLTFEFVDSDTNCSDQQCDNWADVKAGTSRNTHRRELCAAHASEVLQRWIERERSRARLEKVRAEFQNDNS